MQGLFLFLKPIDTLAELATSDVKVILMNMGTDTLTNVPVKFQLNSNSVITYAWAGSLASGEVDTIVIGSISVPAGNNTICAYTEVSGDTNTFNDQYCKNFFGIPQFDAGVVAILEPTGQALTGASLPVRVIVKNHGSSNLTAFSVDYTVNNGTAVTTPWSGTLTPGSTDTVVLPNLTAPAATYSIKAYTSMANDGNHNNDTLNGSAYGIGVDTIPYYDGFDALPVKWVDASTGTTKWEIGVPANGAINAAYSAPNVWMTNLTSDYTINQRAELYTQVFDFSGITNATMSFWRLFRTESGYDGAWIEYNFGDTVWTRLGILNDSTGTNWYNGNVLSAPAWTGLAGTWQKSEILLPMMNNQSYVRFRFVFRSDGSTNYEGFAFDDFQITIPYAQDAGVEAIWLPAATVNGGINATVRARVRNHGLDTLTTIPIAFAVNGGTPVNGVWNGTLAPGDTIMYTFTQQFVAPNQQFSVKVYTALITDQNNLNDTMEKSVFGIPLLNLPYTDDFEGSPKWHTDGTLWEMGTPAASVINAAHSPTNAWATNLDGNYGANENANLYSPRFSFTGASNAMLKVWRWVHAESNSDGGRIEYSTNNGTTWTVLGMVGDTLGTNWYNGTVGGKASWTGVDAGWIQSTYNLAQFNNSASAVRFRFVFSSNATVFNNGLAIDDFQIYFATVDTDATALQIVEPLDGQPAGTSVNVKMKVSNTGLQPLTNLNLSYRVGTGTAVNESWSGNLAVGDTLLYSFTAPYSLPASTHSVCGWVKAAGDPYAFNDTICRMIAVGAGALDVGVVAVYPQTGDSTVWKDSITVSVTIRNFGTQLLTSTPVTYTVNGANPKTETWAGNLASGDTTTYIFTARFASPLSNYQLCGYSGLVGDVDSTNNATCAFPIGYVGMGDIVIDGFSVGQNIPNPANGITLIPVYIPNSGEMMYRVSNSLGQTIYTSKKNGVSGQNHIALDTEPLEAGIYFYSVEYNGAVITRLMIITR
jgi:hypothetical protein